jgi:DNA modification methylase
MDEQLTFEFIERPTIKGYPELRWTGKRPYRSTQYFPAQLRERYGEEQDGWINKIFWGDNIQVMSHLLKNFRGKVDLIYIDPPFDSKADYKKKIALRGQTITNDANSFEEKQYGDIWTNDEYLQFMYERLIIMRELLAATGSIFLHCDDSKNFLLRTLVSEIFGEENFRNEIIWKRSTATGLATKRCGTLHDTIYWYSKSSDYYFKMQYHAHEEEYLKRARKDETGRLYIPIPTGNPGPRPNLYYEYKGYFPHANGYKWTREKLEEYDRQGRLVFPISTDGRIQFKQYLDEVEGVKLQDLWLDVYPVNPVAKERNGYPTQKPESLLNRIISMTTEPNGLVFDCFMGSGTTQAVAMKLGRRFIGADINLGAIQVTTKRLISLAAELQPQEEVQQRFTVISGGRKKQLEMPNYVYADRVAEETGNCLVATRAGESSEPEDEGEPTEDIKYTGFEVYNVNNYEFFRNPIEARDLLIEALEIQPFPQSDIWDGELDGRMVKIMPVNRIATKADLEELKANLPYKTYEKRKEENPNQPVEKITIVCMGHEPGLKASLEAELPEYKLDIEIVDILRDKADLQLKREAEAEVVREGGKLAIRSFYPLNLMQKLSLQKEYVEDWRQLVESIMIDWNYDGVVMQPSVTDIPGKRDMVSGVYDIPSDAGSIKVKITDMLSESLEVEV